MVNLIFAFNHQITHIVAVTIIFTRLIWTLQTLQEIIHLVRTQLFPKNRHFLPPDTLYVWDIPNICKNFIDQIHVHKLDLFSAEQNKIFPRDVGTCYSIVSHILAAETDGNERYVCNVLLDRTSCKLNKVILWKNPCANLNCGFEKKKVKSKTFEIMKEDREACGVLVGCVVIHYWGSF